MKTLKKLSALLTAVVLLVSVFGCSQASGDSKQKNKSEDYSSIADVSFDKKDGIPPVNDELKTLYEKAFRLESDMEFSDVGLAYDKDGSFVSKKSDNSIWCKVDDDRFKTYAELEAFYKSIFTQELAEEKLKRYDKSFKDIDGELYTLCGARGADLTYSGHYFTIDSVSESHVLLTANVYLTDEVVTSNPVYEKQADESRYDIEKVAIEFVKEDDVWKLSQFRLFF